MGDPIGVSRERLPAKPDGLPSCDAASIDRGLDGTPRATIVPTPLEKKTQMHQEDLMNADMLSEIVLLVSGSVIFVTLLLILVAALTQTAALT
jgi:hypothetical protein